MRKTVSGLLLALLLAVVILPGRVSAAGNGFSGGTGTAEDPYQIATAEDLAAYPPVERLPVISRRQTSI